MLHERLHVMSLAGPPNYRRPLGIAWWRTFDRILRGFFDKRLTPGSRVVDLGAGHFQLSDLTRRRGAAVIGVEDDAALAALGRLSGHSVLEMNWNDLSRSSIGGDISGVFSKFSISAIRAQRRSDITSLGRRIDEMVGRRGWGWIAPWNGPVGHVSPERAAALVSCQTRTFRDLGWQHVELTAAQAEYFGVFGSTFNRPLFLKRLSWSEPPDPSTDADLAPLRNVADAHGWLYAERPDVARMVRTEADFSALIGGVLADVIRPDDTILDLRPQYYDLAQTVASRGASVISLERDQLRATRFRVHGYRVFHGEPSDAVNHIGRECLDGVFSWGHACVEHPDQWKSVAADLTAATAMLRPAGWGWVAIEHRTTSAGGRGLGALDRQVRSHGWQLERLPPDSAARFGFRRPNRSVVVASRNCRPAAEPARSSRPVWVVGGSPEREWIAAVLRRRGYMNCVPVSGGEAGRIDLAAGGIVVWYVMGGVSSVPAEISSGWFARSPGPRPAAAGASEDVAVFPLPHNTAAVVMSMATADRFRYALDRLPSRLEQTGAC